MPPGLFGLERSNRDFTQAQAWGKNQFNASFPAALASYMGVRGLPMIYFMLDGLGNLEHTYLPSEQLFGLPPLSSDLFFAFESEFAPYRPHVTGKLPRVDLVTQNIATGLNFAPLEIKLTALPDESTHRLPEESYGSEIVVRPDTIVYLALAIIHHYASCADVLRQILEPACDPLSDNWSEPYEVLPHISGFRKALLELVGDYAPHQKPLLMQPIWKTKGKAMVLEEHCLDIFVWSDLAFTKLFVGEAQGSVIDRPTRSLVWLMRMLYDFSRQGRFEPQRVIDQLTYNTKNDKAFSISGRRTYPLMSSPELRQPRVRREEIRHIILGKGQEFLSPERRLDAAILNTPGLFDENG